MFRLTVFIYWVPLGIVFSGVKSSPIKETKAGLIGGNWPKGIMPYVLDESLYPDWYKYTMAAIKEVERTTCIKFKPKTSDDLYWARFWFNPEVDPLLPNIGWQNKKDQMIKTGYSKTPTGPDTRQMIIHEIMHALGFMHEETRNDREDYVDIQFDNILKRNVFMFVRNEQYNISTTENLSVPYNYESIMHLGRYDSAIDPTKDVITTKVNPKVNDGGLHRTKENVTSEPPDVNRTPIE